MSLPNISIIARAIEREGFEFLDWSDWYLGGRPDLRWTKLHIQTRADTHYVHHSVTSIDKTPVAAALDINTIGINRFGKMSYPFLIHDSGTIIRGCYPYIGAHTGGQNSSSLAGCNIGNFETIAPSPRMVAANGALIRVLRSTNAYPNVPGIKPHLSAPGASTKCPGKYLVAKLPEIARLAFTRSDPEDDDDMKATLSWLPGGHLYLCHGTTATHVDGDAATAIARVRCQAANDSSTKKRPHDEAFLQQIHVLDGPLAGR